jgi:hypothetical protein
MSSPLDAAKGPNPGATMTSTIGQFDYALIKPAGDEPMPFHPWVNICLKHWGAVDPASRSPLVSSNLMSELEIDQHVADLKADLDKVARNAKAALRAATAPK